MGNCEARYEYEMQREELITALVGDVVSGLSVLQARGYAIDDEALKDRANNIVQALISTYEIRRVPETTATAQGQARDAMMAHAKEIIR